MIGASTQVACLNGNAIRHSTVNPLGSFIGAIIMFVVLGFIPGFVFASILKAMGILRVPPAIEIVGLHQLR